MFLFFKMLLEGEDPAPFDWTTVIFIGLMVIVVVFMMILPQRRNKKKAKEMMDSLSVGSKVTTIGGIMGEVVEINESDNSLVIETGDENNKTRMKFIRNAIYTINTPNSTGTSGTNEKPEYNEITADKK